jgi:hypothetical protein
MKTRPWIWIVVGYLCFLGGITTMVVVAVKNRPEEIKLTHPAKP